MSAHLLSKEIQLDSLPELLVRLLSSRDITGKENIYNYLYPRLESLPHPSQMKGLKEAASIICNALREDVELIIWGDYDVDGTTGTSLLLTFFKELGHEATYYIPNRLTEGYGLNSECFFNSFNHLTSKPFLVITVDCGISDKKAVDEIVAAGGKVIITDHHQIPLDKLPECTVVNPNQIGCGFNETKLAGVGVAFYLAVAVRAELEKEGIFTRIPKPNLKQYLGFVALGTISDLVDLTGTNRVLVRAGLESLAGEQSIPGLASLLEGSGLSDGSITSEDISFTVGPRINAAGRLGVAEVAVDLMVCDNSSEGINLFKKLERFNDKRKKLCEECCEAVLNNDNNHLYMGDYSVIASGNFHSGIIGIVASKLVEKYNKPAIVFSCLDQQDGTVHFKGSGRSIPGVDLLGCLHGCADTIMKYGGHTMAAGLTVEGKYFNQFVRMFEYNVDIACKENNFSGLNLHKNHLECSLDDVMSLSFLDYFQLMEPFGPANERPIFLDKSASVVNYKTIGSDRQHLQVVLRGKYENHRAIGFGLGSKIKVIRDKEFLELYFTPMLNRFRNSLSWQVRIIDVL